MVFQFYFICFYGIVCEDIVFNLIWDFKLMVFVDWLKFEEVILFLMFYIWFDLIQIEFFNKCFKLVGMGIEFDILVFIWEELFILIYRVMFVVVYWSGIFFMEGEMFWKIYWEVVNMYIKCKMMWQSDVINVFQGVIDFIFQGVNIIFWYGIFEFVFDQVFLWYFQEFFICWIYLGVVLFWSWVGWEGYIKYCGWGWYNVIVVVFFNVVYWFIYLFSIGIVVWYFFVCGDSLECVVKIVQVVKEQFKFLNFWVYVFLY